MRQIITLEALQVLDSIERKGSFAAAAEELHRVPSAITYTIQKLEQDFGLKLFRREGRRSVLTPAGKELIKEGRKILTATAQLTEKTKQIASGWEPRVNIAIESFFPLEEIYPILAQIYQHQPQTEFNLYEEVLAGTWDALISGRADLVIGAPDLPPQHKGIQFVALKPIKIVVVAGKNHSATRLAMPIEQSQLQAYRLVIARDTATTLPGLNRGLQGRQSVLSVPNMAAKISAHLAGLGVGSVPKFRVQRYLDSGELIELKLTSPLPDAPFYMGWLESNQGKTLQWLVKTIQTHWPI